MTPDQPTAVIFKIQRYSIHDGPGIRTTVFFKGCPLRCLWCHNPESWNTGIEEARGRDASVWQIGRAVGVDGLLGQIKKDVPFYDESGGGVTFSGGEPMMQAAFLREVLPRLGAMDIHTAVDTCGYAPWEAFEPILPHVNLFLYDIKHMDESRHIAYTGRPNGLIQDNLRRLAASGAKVLARVPVLPGVNDDDENTQAAAALLNEAGVKRIELLPYHHSGAHKYDKLSMDYRLAGMRPPDGTTIRRIAGIFAAAGIGVRLEGKAYDGKG